MRTSLRINPFGECCLQEQVVKVTWGESLSTTTWKIREKIVNNYRENKGRQIRGKIKMTQILGSKELVGGGGWCKP